MTLGEIAEATDGTLSEPGAGGLVVDGPVVTDSREVGPGGLFVARVGERADGHDYLPAARAAGAVGALTSRPVAGLPCVVVADVQTAFGRLARAVVDHAVGAGGLVVIGVTGSSGKTTTKDLLAQVLGTAGATVASVGSYNGEVGVPLTVCRVTGDTRFLVAEMGARGVGHIAYLTGIAPPRIGVVLNVGSAHVGEFGSREAIARAKGELVEALPADGLAVLNADDPLVAAMAGRTGARVTMVGEHPDAQVRAEQVSLDDLGRAAFRLVTPRGSAPVSLRLHGRHHVGNALAVAAVALECGLEPGAIADALAAAGPVSRWRMEVSERPDGVTVVNDAYNANPESMAAALDALASLARPEAGQRRAWAVLGEMLELGEQSPTAHHAVGAHAARVAAEVLVVGSGPGAADLAAGARTTSGQSRVHACPDADAAYELLVRELRPGDVVLVKSSNATGLRFLGDRIAGREVES